MPKDRLAPKTRVKLEQLLEIVRPIEENRIFTPDIEKIAQFLIG